MEGCDVSWWITARVNSSLKRRYSVGRDRRGASAILWANARRLILAPAFKQIPPLDQYTQLLLGHAAMEHPEAAIGMNVAQPSFAEGPHDLFDPARDQRRFFNFVVLDVDNADPQADLRVEFEQIGQRPVATAGEFENEVIGMQGIEKGDQVAPETFLYCLPPVIAEADMDCFLCPDSIEHMVDRLGRPLPVLRMPADVRLVQLNDRGVDRFELLAQDYRQIQRQLRRSRIVAVRQDFGQHMRARTGELQRPPGKPAHGSEIAGKIESRLSDLSVNDARRGGAIVEPPVCAESIEIGQRKARSDPVHLREEVIDHSVRFRMAWIKSLQFSIADHIQSCKLLSFQDRQDRILQGDTRAVSHQPGGDRITPHDGCFDLWLHALLVVC